MNDVGDGPILDDLRTVLEQLDNCLSVLREKVAELSASRGDDSDDGG